MSIHPSHLFYSILFLHAFVVNAQDSGKYKLVWSDEFNKKGRHDTSKWDYERGFVRNEEL